MTVYISARVAWPWTSGTAGSTVVDHRTIDDPDNGGSYTVKRYRSRERAVERRALGA